MLTVTKTVCQVGTIADADAPHVLYKVHGTDADNCEANLLIMKIAISSAGTLLPDLQFCKHMPHA